MDRQPPINADFGVSEAEKSRLAAENSKPENWEWFDLEDHGWKEAAEKWQKFSKEWYGNDSLLSESLHIGNIGADIPSIIVLQPYVTMFDHVWAQAFKLSGRNGVIITGQPGIGKTLFQYYLLARLLQLKQVVLFSVDSDDLFLFYHGRVYTALSTLLESSLPQPKLDHPDIFIWSLFDIEKAEGPHPYMHKHPCFPVQTASLLNPIQYKEWRKQKNPMFTALPLWTREELALGFKHQAGYNALCKELYNPPPDWQMLSGIWAILKDCEDDITMAKEALLEEQEQELETEAEETETEAEEVETETEKVETEAEKVERVEKALDNLLDAAIERFGYAPRVVYQAIFDYDSTTQQHLDAFTGINLEVLKTISSSLLNFDNSKVNPDVSNAIFVVYPKYPALNPLGMVGLNVEFKSRWVSTEIMKRLHDFAIV